MSRDDFLLGFGLPVEFPHFFPPQLEEYRRSLAEAADTPDEYGVAYMLAAAATAIGAEVSGCVQPGWCIRANLFLAVIGYKGSGKTTLRNKVLAPLVQHEEELRERAVIALIDEDYEEADEEVGGVRRAAKQPEPCVIVNDCTGPAVLRLLEHNRRQLLVNADEISALFIRNTGGTDRQLWCELYDGQRRRQQRASAGGLSVTLAAPYVSILGGIQPDLLKCMYGSRGDDGFLDRLLLVGERSTREANWPRDADDPSLNAAWAAAITRMLHMEELAADAIGDGVEARFMPAAVDVCQRLLRRLNELVALIGVPEPQRGIVKKLVQHAVKLALLHRCIRWAAGEFGERGALGDVDAEDATAACEAALFFFGRWLLWRPELAGVSLSQGSEQVGLVGPPGGDPALEALAVTAAEAQAGIRLIERLVRHLRNHADEHVAISAVMSSLPFATDTPDELRAACEWLVAQQQAEWVDEHRQTIRLLTSTTPATKQGQRRRLISRERITQEAGA
jgi:energy-coupling factor transporter ATP-binding protein EcfA2